MTEQPPGLPPQEPPPVAPPAAVPAPPVAPAAPPVAPPPVAQPAAQPAPAAPQYGYVPASGRPGPMPGVYFAGHPSRLIAWILDGIVLSVVVTLLYLVIGIVGALVSGASEELGGLILVVGWVIVLIIGLVWYPYWWSKSGQSPGKKLMHLKVVRADNGELVGLGGGFVRLFGYWVAAVVFYIGFLWILVDGKRQGWADKIASTYVIEVP